MEDAYDAIAKDAISKAEERRQDSLETFYRGLRTMRDAIDERMMCASADGLSEGVIAEILR